MAWIYDHKTQEVCEVTFDRMTAFYLDMHHALYVKRETFTVPHEYKSRVRLAGLVETVFSPTRNQFVTDVYIDHHQVYRFTSYDIKEALHIHPVILRNAIDGVYQQ